MKTNLLSNLSNGLKKGTGLTQVGYRQGTGKVQAGEKQACGRKESLAWSQVELISDEGAIEHPLSTHSAPFGIRWKPAGEKGSSRVWKHVAMIFAVLVMSIANIGMAWGVEITINRFALDGTTILPLNTTSMFLQDEVDFAYSGTPALSSGGLSIAASSTTTISAHGKTITGMTIVFNNANNSSTISSGTATWTNSNKTMNWSGSATSITITSGVATRINSAVITYTDATPLSDVSSTTLTTFIRPYNSNNVSIIGSSKSPSAPGVNISGAFDSNVKLNYNTSTNGTNTNAIRIVSPKAISSIVYTWSTAPSATQTSSGSYDSGTSTWTAANTTTTDVSLYNRGSAKAVFSKIVVNFVGSTPSCTSITPTWSTDYSSTTLNVGATSSTPVVGKGGSSGAVSFSSSDASIASVNSSTGVVTGVGAGNATITATVAANGDYCSGTVTKEFTIKAGVTYNANGADGGSVPTDASTYAYNANITVAGNTGSLYKTGFVFNGWNTRSDGTGTHYEAGATMKMPSKSAGITLYAEWVGYATSWEWWNCGQSNNSTTFTYITSKNYICSFASSASTAVASWDMSGGEYYRGIKIKTKDHSIAFWVQTGKRVSITFGTRPTKPTFTVGGVDKSSDVGASNNADSITVTYTTTGDTKFYIENETATNTAFTVKSVKIEDAAPSCTAPNHVEISGRWDRFGGETISLTATAYSSAGTGSPIADGNITGWQWEKLIGSTWTPLSNGTAAGVTISGATTKNLQIANSGAGNSGKYRCVVSTGATCSTPSATATDGSQGFGVKVYVLECYNGGTTEHHFTRTGDTQAGTLTMTLSANTAYTFKVHADNTYYGNGGTIDKDETNWVMCNSDNGDDCAKNLTVNSGLGGTFTFGIEYSTSGSSSVEGEPEISVTYPRKTMYLVPNSDWMSNSAKFAFYYYGTSGTGWTDFLTSNDCGMSAEIPQWNGLKVIAVRFNSSKASTGNWDDKWNQTDDITATADKNCVTITDWNAGTYGTYSIPTYTISYNAGTGGSGSKASESKTCGVAFTLPGSTFTYAGHSQDGWAISNGGATAYALSGSYTTNAAQEFFPHWKCNTPTITDNGDNTVTIAVPAGTTVRYTTDGTNPTSSTGTVYSSAFTIDATVTVKAIAYQSGCTDSEIASQVCTYHAPVATAMVTWNLNVGTSATTTIFSSGDSDDHTNIPVANITVDQTNDGANGAGQSDRTTKILIKTGANGADWSEDPTNYEIFKFKVACGKKLTPSKIHMPVANVGSSSANNIKYKAVLSDNFGHTLSGTYVVTTQNGTIEDFDINNADASKYFQGEVTLKLWAWTIASKDNGGSAFRMGTPVEIYGTIGNQATPAATITWNTQPANGRVGDPDFAYDVTCSDGSAVTVTSADPSVATIVGGKLHYVATGTTHLVATATDACGNTVSSVNSSNFTVSAAAATYSVTHSLTNVTATSGATGAGAATEGVAYDAVFAANSGYVLPSTITVTIGGSPATVGTGYTWNASTGAFQVPAAQVTGAIVITIAGETAPATKDIYYGAITITTGALTRGSTGTAQFFTNIGGTIENNTEISWSSGPSTASQYYNSNNLTGTELSKSSNWTTSSSSNRYIMGFKFQSGSTYTLALGSKVASSITFYGRNGSESRTMTIGGEEWTSSATKNTHAKHEFTKSGGFTGNVTITEDGDFYGILVITIQTATPCTTPTLPTATLSDQGVCEGSDIAAWDATVTNASAISAAGETVAYSWKKKGNDTELANTATFDLGSSATESQAGTYVVTVTVSKAGKASSSAYREVELSVTEETEVTNITADKATVYAGNSVTLTATANATITSWQWYTCTSAEGAGEAIISGAASASYTITSAPAAGTNYYKVKVTSDCGNAERVYALVVSPAAGGDCFHFVSVIPASDFNASSGASLVTPTHATTLEGGTMKVGSQQVTFTKDYGLKMEGTKTVSITLESALEAGNVVNVKGTSGTKGNGITINGVNFYDADNKTFDVSYTVLADDGLVGKTALTVSKYSGNSYLQEVKITGCGESCTDPEVTASADNTTACVGTSVTFTATGAHAEATYQWQKLDGTWTNISGATASTYNIASVVAGDAGKYRVIASNDCNRTSNEVTLSVPSVPDFGSTVPASVSVMQTIALSINTVEATDAVKYRWYKSADPTWDAGDVEIGTNKELIKAYDSEAIGSPSYYIFCRAQNSCGITTSSAIAVNVTTYVEEDCATRGNEGEAQFGFENSGAGQGSYESTACWTMNSNSKILVYYPPTGKYFKTAKVTIASNSASKASYNWSTNGGTDYTAVSLTVNSTLTERTIDLSAHGNVDAFQIGRNFNSTGESSGTLYVSKICFEYTEACTATTVTPSESSVNYEMGGAWSNPTFTLSVAGTLTYSSSNEDIASVDDDGTVTFNGDAGTVTITASYAGGTISETEYCASSGSYIINVSCPGGAPKIVPASSVDLSGCNASVTLNAKKQDGTAFADGTYQWFRNGEEIDDATSSSYTATQAGTYTVERTNGSGCTTPSTNSAIVTSETTEPEVERLVPFQYYHVDKTYSDQMKMRHLFAVKNSGTLDGKSFKMYVSRSGGAATDVTSSNALVVVPNGDGHVDTVMVDLNKLSGKYSENDELVFTCKAIDCSGNVSDVYKNTITMRVIGATPTLALICSGSSKAEGTRKTGELTVGGDFLTGYNVADLCEQTGNTSFDANTEWGLYTDLKTQYIVTPVNGYAVFNKLNYEPFDILLLTDYPKASKSDAAKDVLDDMAALCDYRPMLSFKTHMVAKSPSKWAAKGFTTSPVVTKADGRLNLNIVCYAHPMFNSLKTGDDVYTDVGNTSAPLVYTMLTGTGYESSKGMQGFELAAAENFVTIGLTHYNATIAKNSPLAGEVEWTPGSEDRMLVTVAERQANLEARFILFSLNCGAQSKLTDKGEEVILACLEYLLDDDPLHVADCSFTFDNGENNEHEASWYASNCPECHGTKGDHKWTTAANWGPDYRLLPGEFTSVRIKKPVEVNDEHAHVMEVRIIDEGSIDIPAGKALDVKSTIRRMEGSEIYPTEIGDIHIGSASTGNGTLIFNNNDGDTKARVDMYSTAKADTEHMNAGTSTWQYIGTPHTDVVNARSNYYGSWIYQYDTGTEGWTVIPNGGPLEAFRGYCITNENAPVVYDMRGTLAATTSQDISIPAGKYVVVANSWVAPIDINKLTDDDLEGITEKTIYFFNTGNDTTGTGTTTESATGDARWAAGTYISVPIHSAPYTSGSDDHIPSMQGFYVVGGSSAGTLHLDYDKHVRGTTRESILSGRMHAPRRVKASADEPSVLKIFARGSHYDDRLIILEREDFIRGYDSGWDGEAWGGSDLSPMVYVTGDGREDAVSAIPEFEGTVIAFKAGEDSEYRLDFVYDGEESLYLLDIDNNTYTQIMTGNAYYFTTSDKAPHSRFILTRKAPQIATGIEPTSDSSLKGRAKKLLIDDKMYILLNGTLYDATGKMVK